MKILLNHRLFINICTIFSAKSSEEQVIQIEEQCERLNLETAFSLPERKEECENDFIKRRVSERSTDVDKGMTMSGMGSGECAKSAFSVFKRTKKGLEPKNLSDDTFCSTNSDEEEEELSRLHEMGEKRKKDNLNEKKRTQGNQRPPLMVQEENGMDPRTSTVQNAQPKKTSAVVNFIEIFHREREREYCFKPIRSESSDDE